MNEHPECPQKEVCAFIKDKYNIAITTSTVSRCLKKVGWKTKRAQIKDHRIKEEARLKEAEEEQEELRQQLLGQEGSA